MWDPEFGGSSTREYLDRPVGREIKLFYWERLGVGGYLEGFPRSPIYRGNFYIRRLDLLVPLGMSCAAN